MSTSENKPDAELIEVCARFDELERKLDAGPDEDEPYVAFCAAISEQQGPLLDLLVTLHATTLEGHRARARSFLLHVRGELGGPAPDERILHALVRDLAAESPPTR